MLTHRLLRRGLLASGFLLSLSPAFAQNNPGYFIPPAAHPAPVERQVRPAVRPPPRQMPAPAAAPMMQPVMPMPAAPGPVAGPGAEEGPPMQLQLPPAPDLPPMPKGTAPPAAVIGVLGIPEIMHASTAAQQVEKVITERREKLNQDAQKEQAVWRDMQQALANERAKMSADQIRAKERELQERITNAQKTFRNRNQIIQEAGQYGLAQIERMLIGVIREVAESRGMNLVLHRAQVALNVNEFDITDQVTEQLNKVLPSVNLPAEGVAPPMAAAAPPAAMPAAAQTSGRPAPTPAPAPSTPPAAPAPASAPQSAPGSR